MAWRPPSIGELDTPVEFLDGQGTDRLDGGQDVTPLVIGTDWAKVEATGGSEAVQMDAPTMTLTWQVTIRRREDLLPSMSVRWDGLARAIAAIVPVGRLWLILQCTEAIR